MASQIAAEKELVCLTNKLLHHLHVSQEVECVADITAEIFVIIFEGLYGERLPELHGKPLTREDSIHNCQVVIDALATKILNTSLSHITGESIINRNRQAISNLLEIFTDLLDFLTEKIETVQDVVDDGLEEFIHDKAFVKEWIHKKHFQDYEDEKLSPGAPASCSRFAWQDINTVERKKDIQNKLEADILNATMYGSYQVPEVSKPGLSVPDHDPEILYQLADLSNQVQKSSKIQKREKENSEPLLFPTSKPPEYIDKVSSCQTKPFYNQSSNANHYEERVPNNPQKIIRTGTNISSFSRTIKRNSDSTTQTEKPASNSDSNDIIERYQPGRSTNQLLDMIESALKQLEIESQPATVNKGPQKQVHFEDVYRKENYLHQNPTTCHDWRRNRQLQFLKKNYSDDLSQFAEDIQTHLNTNLNNSAGPLVKQQKPVRKRSVSSSYCHKKKPMANSYSHKTEINAETLLPNLLGQLPLLHLSTETWHELWRKNIHQLEYLTKSYYEKHRKRDTSKQQIKDAEKRREILNDIMKKELSHMQRMKEIKENKKRCFEVKNRLHDKRMISVKARRYYDDFSVRMRSRMMNHKTKEEMIFKNMFKDCLQVQKERVLELQKYVGELRKQRFQTLQNDIQSMENYYCDQFGMIAEAMKKQLAEKQMIHNEHYKLKSDMKRELRKKMEKDIHRIQDQLCNDKDHIHFRQLDTDWLKKELQMANYVFKSRPHQCVV